MTANDRILLNEILEQQKNLVDPNATASDFFELFTAEQILKDFDLSYDEIESGLIGGGNDGGVDSMYVLVNGEIFREESDLSQLKSNITLDVIIIQSKTSDGFSETPVERFITISGDIFDLSKDTDDFADLYNESLIRAIERYRSVYKQLAARFPQLKITFCYASKGSKPSKGVTNKSEKLLTQVNSLFSSAEIAFEFVGASELLELARRAPQTTYTLTLAENPISSEGDVGFVCLIKLVHFYEFLKDSSGNIHRQIFEANVRDYQGRTQVNDQIQNTLQGEVSEDFWWLNNGVSIVAAKASQSGKTITVEDPQIVNGLQTSTEIFSYCKNCNTENENRMLLVRIVVPSEPESRDQIIKATNSQTSVVPASLRATDKIQRDIEEFLKPRGLYYDRRKNYYKNQGKPRSSIIGIPYLAQSVMSVVLGRPDTARARPSSLLKKDDDYVKIFSEKFPIELYYVCAESMRLVTEYFKVATPALTTAERTDLKFYVVMHVVRSLVGKKSPKPVDFANIIPSDLTDQRIQSSLAIVKNWYVDLGATDKVAKGSSLVAAVKKSLDKSLQTIGQSSEKAAQT